MIIFYLQKLAEDDDYDGEEPPQFSDEDMPDLDKGMLLILYMLRVGITLFIILVF